MAQFDTNENETSVTLDPKAVIRAAFDRRADELKTELEYQSAIDSLMETVNAQTETVNKLIEAQSNNMDRLIDGIADLSDAVDDSEAPSSGRGARKRGGPGRRRPADDDDDEDVSEDEARRRAEYERIEQEEQANKEQSRRRERDRKILDDRYFKAQQELVSKFENSVSSQTYGSFNSLLNGIYSADLKSLTGGISDLIGRVGEGEIESTGLAAVLEGMGMTGAAEAASTVSAYIGGPAMAAIIGGITSTDAIMDRVAQARYAAMQQGLTGLDAATLGPGAAWQDALRSFGSGIDTKTIQNVRETLFKNQAEWGSDEYNQGFDFAMNAQGRYGISATSAAKYYTEQVVKGGESMEELSRQMEYLHKTVENTSIGMEQMETVIANNTATLAKSSMGGDTLAAQSVALDMQRYFTEGTGRESQIAAGMMGNVNFATDPLAYQRMQDYLGQGYDETQAMMLVGMDYVSEGRVLGTYGGINYFTTPLDEGKGSLKQYLDARDWEGLEAALTDFWDGNALNPAMTYFGLRAALKAQFGFTDQDVESPETITSAFRSAYGGMDNAAEGGDFEYQQDIATDISERRFTDPGAYMGLGWTLRGTRNIDALMSSDDAVNLWSDNGRQFTGTGIELMQQLADAGVDLGDQVTETELNAIGESLREAYSASGTDDSFSEWLHTSDAVSQAQQIADKMDAQPTSETTTRTGVNVEISFVDDAATLLLAKVREAQDIDNRDSGGQAGGGE